MGSNVQLLVVLGLVAAATVYLLRQTWRTWTVKKGCGGCHCSKSTVEAPVAKIILSSEITVRRRATRGL